MKRKKDDEFMFKYEKEDIDDFILKVLKKNPNGLTHTELMAKMLKDLNKKVIEGFMLLLVNSGEIIPEISFRINKGETSESEFVGFYNDKIRELHDEVYNDWRACPKNCVNGHKVVEIPKEKTWSWHEKEKRKKRILSTKCLIISTSGG